MNPFPLSAALDLLTHELNAYIQQVGQSSQNVVILAPVVNPDGSLPAEIEDKVVLSVINLEPLSPTRNQPPATHPPSPTATVDLHVHILCAATFLHYQSGLSAISSVLAFFRSTPVFTVQNAPNLDPTIDRLMIELTSLSYSDINHIWSAIGARYRPSVVYQMRMMSNKTATPHQAVQLSEPL